ncbi:OPT superfamily oligopeptide transporter [Zopfia rhizophila CBS 207.26]|uniref:OPT superfamily oligopeptide transporter n=1 Tax=Zopfia rhizophila CBS 207.26 TaxID=1314779 RepID=A0A6A6E0R8_9PEZI|nr:OPT superfamily oligopeptide transporter [Zopfia rhizophila CBS 207.26]
MSSSIRMAPRNNTSHFTLRAVVVGLFIGVLNCICNAYFILQAGWGTDLSMSSSVIGFALFKTRPFARHPLTAAETVLIQTVASTTGMMILSVGFAGVFPALEFLLKPQEGAPVNLHLGRLMLWGLGICLVGSMFSAFLRKQMILKEKLRYATGTATATLISVLHRVPTSDGDSVSSLETNDDNDSTSVEQTADLSQTYIRYLITALAISALFSLASAFVPEVREIPVFGRYLASHWLWSLDLSPAYIGQGAILGPGTTAQVLLGAIVAWGILSPLAVHKGWAADAIGDFERGPKGWLIWIALAVLLPDSILDLSWLVIKTVATYVQTVPKFSFFSAFRYQRLPSWRSSIMTTSESHSQERFTSDTCASAKDAFISNRTISILFGSACAFAIVSVYITYGSYMPFWTILVALLLSPPASIIAARSLGETDFTPNSGIAKIAQLVFAIITPTSDPNALLVNLLAGSISESGAQQASDIMQDFKTAYLVDASATAQFQGHIIGSLFGALISPAVYRAFTSLCTIPSQLFQIPSAHLWLFTARLLRGDGLPAMVPQTGSVFALVFIALKVLKVYLASPPSPRGHMWARYIPSGVAVAIGIYATPSFSLPRAVGGLLNWMYLRRHPEGKTTVYIVASGLIVGEGVMSIVSLFLRSLVVSKA